MDENPQPVNLPTARLLTREGHGVADVQILPMTPWPDVIAWGSRVFVKGPSAEKQDCPSYYEGMMVVPVPQMLERPVTPPTGRQDLTLYANAVTLLQFGRLTADEQRDATILARTAGDPQTPEVAAMGALRKLGALLLKGGDTVSPVRP